MGNFILGATVRARQCDQIGRLYRNLGYSLNLLLAFFVLQNVNFYCCHVPIMLYSHQLIQILTAMATQMWFCPYETILEESKFCFQIVDTRQQQHIMSEKEIM